MILLCGCHPWVSSRSFVRDVKDLKTPAKGGLVMDVTLSQIQFLRARERHGRSGWRNFDLLLSFHVDKVLRGSYGQSLVKVKDSEHHYVVMSEWRGEFFYVDAGGHPNIVPGMKGRLFFDGASPARSRHATLVLVNPHLPAAPPENVQDGGKVILITDPAGKQETP